MFELVDVSRLDAAAALDVVEAAGRARRLAEAQQAMAMLRVVTTYRHELLTHKVRLGAEGTRLVDDFACLELAAVLHRDPASVTAEVAELLTLERRHPQLWQQVCAGEFALWLARNLARMAWELPLEAARWLDATLAPFTNRLGPTRLQKFAEALIVQADPQAAMERSERSRKQRTVVVGQSEHGVTKLYGMVDAADGIYLDAALAQLADILATRGDESSLEVRRATALGILATPARALALIQSSLQPAIGDEATAAAVDTAAREAHSLPGHACGTVTVKPDRLLPKATLIVHLSDQTLATGQGIGRVENVGPVTLEQLQVLLHNKRITVRPVFDPDGVAPVDSYEIPARIRRAVLARDPIEVFPYSSRASRNLDLDHTRPFRWDGTPGQTAVGNLGPLSRKVHRAKTHANWRLAQPESGVFEWTSPLGRRYLVTRSGLTHALPAPPRAGSRSTGARTAVRLRR